jgi:hypothetical protein
MFEDGSSVMSKRVIVAGLSAAALAVPAVASASPQHGVGHQPAPAAHAGAGKASGKAKAAHPVAFVFRGTFTAPGTVTVTSGNAHVRKGGFVGNTVVFDLSGARIAAADTNGDQVVDPRDIKDGDRVLVQARLPKLTTFSAPAAGDTAAAIAATRLIDQTNQPTDD